MKWNQEIPYHLQNANYVTRYLGIVSDIFFTQFHGEIRSLVIRMGPYDTIWNGMGLDGTYQ